MWGRVLDAAGRVLATIIVRESKVPIGSPRLDPSMATLDSPVLGALGRLSCVSELPEQQNAGILTFGQRRHSGNARYSSFGMHSDENSFDFVGG